MTPSVNPYGRPLIGRPTTSSTGHLAGAFESSSRFEGASEMASNAIILMDLTPLACIIISLGHLLIDRSLGGAMDSVYVAPQKSQPPVLGKSAFFKLQISQISAFLKQSDRMLMFRFFNQVVCQDKGFPYVNWLTNIAHLYEDVNEGQPSATSYPDVLG